MSASGETSRARPRKSKTKEKASLQAPSGKKLELNKVSVKSALKEDKVVFFEIWFSTGSNGWRTNKRYSQFEQLRSRLKTRFSQIPNLPPKRWLPVDLNFIEQRRVLLNNFIERVTQIDSLRMSQELVCWLMDNAERREVTDNSDEKFPESQEITSISIPTTRKMSDHMLYKIDYCNSRKTEDFRNWTTLKRFGQFFDMDTALREWVKANHLELLKEMPNPPQRRPKVIVDHLSKKFVEERRALLESYMNKLLLIPKIANSEVFMDFAGLKGD